MLTRSFACAIPLILTEAVSAAPLHLPSRRENFDPPASTRLEFVNAANPFNFDVVDLDGDGAIIYVANITVDGISYEVQLDTGSSDLWLNTQNTTLSSAANDTGISTTIVYGDTTVATGDIYVAAAQFGNFSIPSQAFINAPGSNATSDNDLGLIGLSTRNISEVYSSLENTSYDGNPLLYNIFSTYPNVSNYMTFLLARSNLGITEGGVFTIGEVDPGWSAVKNQTQIPVVAGLQQWIGLTDGIVVNGKKYSGHGLLSEVEGVPKDLRKKTLSLLDSGTSLGTLPPHYWDTVYGNIEGIEVYDEENGIFSVPCDTKVNVSIVFNGTEYPINPLDLTQLMTTGSFSNGTNETLCVNAFVPAEMSDQGFDIILGDTFMRNVYALFNFGNWTASGDEPPFIQLLSTTNQSDAWAQFDDLNAARIQQWNQLMGQYNLTSSSGGKSSSARARKTSRMTPIQTSQDVSGVEEAVKTYNHWANSP